MSHDQRPARVKVVSAKRGPASSPEAARGDIALVTATAPPARTARTGLPPVLLSLLFIVGAIAGGIGATFALLGGR